MILFEKLWSVQGFPVFNFGHYSEIKNSENSEMFSRHVNFKECLLFEEVGNFRGFCVFDFGPSNEIEKLWKLESFVLSESVSFEEL